MCLQLWLTQQNSTVARRYYTAHEFGNTTNHRTTAAQSGQDIDLRKYHNDAIALRVASGKRSLVKFKSEGCK